MGPTKIMIIRHAEKPGIYGSTTYKGINAEGDKDESSLVTMGWERAGAIANLFYPTNNIFQNKAISKPDFIYASDPADKSDGEEPSQRPYQTISALAAKMKLPASHLNISSKKKDYAKMVTSVLGVSGTVLISWQHQDILPKDKGVDCIVNEILNQSSTPASSLPIPAGPWPASRYDMVFVFERLNGSGPFTNFTQVPQLLLAGDLNTTFPIK